MNLATTMPDLFSFFDPGVDGAWIVLTAMTVNVGCAILGCYLILRKLSLMGDALSHAVLPGLVIAVILSGSMGILPLFIGAALVGFLTTFLIQTLHQYGRVPSDASMGIVFTALFALGVVLVKKYLGGLHFDFGCIYEGALEFVPFAERVMGLPRPLFTSLVMLLVNLAFVLLFWKELKVSSFDPAMATSMGFSATTMHYLLLMLVSITTVASFEAVGAILVVAVLIVPAATAHLLTDRLGPMVAVACLVGVISAILGYGAAVYWDTNIAGMITVACGAIYTVAVLFSPKYGLVSAMIQNLRMTLSVLREDLLAMLYRIEEFGNQRQLTTSEARAALSDRWLSSWGIYQLVRSAQVARHGKFLQLTDKGRDAARQLVRSHRLWEAYLVEHWGMPLDHVHEPAHRVEHYLDEEMRQEIEAKLDSSAQDPHGREIP